MPLADNFTYMFTCQSVPKYLMKAVHYNLQDQEGSEDDKPEQLSESSLGVVGICKTRDVCAGHEALDKKINV